MAEYTTDETLQEWREKAERHLRRPAMPEPSQTPVAIPVRYCDLCGERAEWRLAGERAARRLMPVYVCSECKRTTTEYAERLA